MYMYKIKQTTNKYMINLELSFKKTNKKNKK